MFEQQDCGPTMSISDYGEPPARPGAPGYWTPEDRLRAEQPIPEQSEAHRLLNKPAIADGQRIRMADRHIISRISAKSMARDQNTVIESWVPWRRELDAIARGDGARLAEPYLIRGRTGNGDLFAINGRVYVVQSTGKCFPYRGPAVHPLSRRDYEMLNLLLNSPASEARAEVIRQYAIRESGQRLEFLQRLAAEPR